MPFIDEKGYIVALVDCPINALTCLGTLLASLLRFLIDLSFKKLENLFQSTKSKPIS